MADLDGDGDVDVLFSAQESSGQGSANNKIAWYENTDGKGTFGRQQVIATEQGEDVSALFAADMDGDGDLDVLSTSWGKTAWYENLDGKGTFGHQQVIPSLSGGLWWFPSVRSAVPILVALGDRPGPRRLSTESVVSIAKFK